MLSMGQLLEIDLPQNRNQAEILCTLYGVWDGDFHQKNSNLIFFFILVLLNFFSRYYCSIYFKRESELSSIGLDRTVLFG